MPNSPFTHVCPALRSSWPSAGDLGPMRVEGWPLQREFSVTSKLGNTAVPSSRQMPTTTLRALFSVLCDRTPRHFSCHMVWQFTVEFFLSCVKFHARKSVI